MLRELVIKNFAIIDDMKIHFLDGLTILSGETGAGKSILIHAVNLLLGTRASSKLIKTGALSAELDALFDIKFGSRTAEIMRENDFDPSEGLLIRRIISLNDKHKIYINNRLSTISFLGLLTENLAIISGQHANQNFLKEENHLLILDRFGDLIGLRDKVCNLYQNLELSVRKLKKLKSGEENRSSRLDFLKFQYNEISSASISPDEDIVLEKKRIILKNGEKLYKTIYESIEQLYVGQGAVMAVLSQVEKNMKAIFLVDSQLKEYVKKISDVKYQLEDINAELNSYLEKIETDEKCLEDVESRLYAISKLKKKYGGSIDAVLKRKKEIELELEEKKNISEIIKETEEDILSIYEKVSIVALELSKKRRSAGKIFATKVENELDSLKMSKTIFEVHLESNFCPKDTEQYFKVDENMLTETGLEKALFNISPNLGEELKPLANIASGGELSRVVLALKSIFAAIENVGTIIFDEVDAGIGGGVAEVVGRKLVSLSKFHQIICITHLPQIAKFGDHNFKITKHIEDDRTKTVIAPLDKEEKVKEIARMLGGAEITETTLTHAKEILNNVSSIKKQIYSFIPDSPSKSLFNIFSTIII